jgi:hypothetical protein
VHNTESVSMLVTFLCPVRYAGLTQSVSLANMLLLISHEDKDVLGFNYKLHLWTRKGVGLYLHTSLITSFGGVPW